MTPEQLTGRRDALVRIIANDGFNSSAPVNLRLKGTRQAQLTASLGDLWGLPSESTVAALLGSCLIDVSSLGVSAWPWGATSHRKGSRVVHRATVRRPLAGFFGTTKGHTQAGRPGHTHRLSGFPGVDPWLTAPSSSYILTKDQCLLSTVRNQTPAGVSGAPGVSERADAGTGLAMAGALLVPLAVSPLLLVAGLKLGSDSEMIRHNFHRLELRRQTISPGRTAHGVVYFGLTDDQLKNPSPSLVVQVSLQDLKTGAVETIPVPFELRTP